MIKTFDNTRFTIDVLNMFQQVSSKWDLGGKEIVQELLELGLESSRGYGTSETGWQSFILRGEVEVFVRFEPGWLELTANLKQEPVENLDTDQQVLSFSKSFERTSETLSRELGMASTVEDVLLQESIQSSAWVVRDELLFCLTMNQDDTELPYYLSFTLRLREPAL